MTELYTGASYHVALVHLLLMQVRNKLSRRTLPGQKISGTSAAVVSKMTKTSHAERADEAAPLWDKDLWLMLHSSIVNACGRGGGPHFPFRSAWSRGTAGLAMGA